MPTDIAADEKHSKLRKEKIYIPTTVGRGCILGAEVCGDANAEELARGYKVFAEESRNVDPGYAPKTVNTDGWEPTKLAFTALFTGVVIIRCFLHAFIKVRDCSRKLGLFRVVCNKIWHVYRAKDKKSFSQRLRRLKCWSEQNLEGTTAAQKISVIHSRSREYQVAYEHPDCHRTSNMYSGPHCQDSNSLILR